MGKRLGGIAALLGLALGSSALAQPAPPQPPPSAPPAPPVEMAAPPTHHLDGCPKGVPDYQDSDATAALVEKCLGRPIHVDHNPDGRFVYVYTFKDGTIFVAFLFDKTGALIRFRAYSVGPK